MLDAGCWILDAGCWILDAGCWILARYRNGETQYLNISISQYPDSDPAWFQPGSIREAYRKHGQSISKA